MISLIFISLLFSYQDAVCSLIPTAHDTVQMLSAPADSEYPGWFASHEASDAFLGQTRQPPLSGLPIGLLPLGTNYVPHATQMRQVLQGKPFEYPVGQADRVAFQMANDDVHRWNTNRDIGQPYDQFIPESYDMRASSTDHIGPYFNSWNTQGLPAAMKMDNPLLHPGQHDHDPPSLAAHLAIRYSPQVQDEGHYTNLLRHPGNLGIFHGNSEDSVMIGELLEFLETKISQRETSHAITPGNAFSDTQPSHFVASAIGSNFIDPIPSSVITDQHAHNNAGQAYVTHRQTAGATTRDLEQLTSTTIAQRRNISIKRFIEEKKARLARLEEIDVNTLNPSPARFPTQSAPREPEVATPGAPADPLPTPEIKLRFKTDVAQDFLEHHSSNLPPWLVSSKFPSDTHPADFARLIWNIENFLGTLQKRNTALEFRVKKLFAFLWRAQEAASKDLPGKELYLLNSQQHGFTYLASLLSHPEVAIQKIATIPGTRPALTESDYQNLGPLPRLIRYLTYSDNGIGPRTVGLDVLLAWTRDFFPELDKKLSNPDPNTHLEFNQNLIYLVKSFQERDQNTPKKRKWSKLGLE